MRTLGLYDDRLADLSESRRSPSRARRSIFSRPFARPAQSAPVAAPKKRKSKKPPTKVQTLLFSRSAGWTASKAKAWAKSHGYKYGKVHVTDQYIRIRQFDPKGKKVMRTIPFGTKGIRAVVAREGTRAMTRTVKAKRRRRKVKAAVAAPRRRRRKTSARKRPAHRRRRRAVKVEAKRTRRRRRRVAAAVAAPRRRRRRVASWRRDKEGHSKAARKGWRRKKKSSTRRRRRRVRAAVAEAPRRRRRRRHAAPAAPVRRRRRRRAHAAAPVMQAHRRRRHMRASGPAMSGGELALGVLFGGIGFAAADALDRFLATYNPSDTERPKDKFTSDGTGTLANTLNIATRPGLVRLGAGIGVTAVPAISSMYIRNAGLRSSLQGMSIGAGVSLFKSILNNFLMPMLIGKDTSPAKLQGSYIARLYPAETAASINMKAIDAAKKAGQTPAMNVSPGSSGLSGADVGPHALGGDSPYPNAVESLRRSAGVSDQAYPDAAEALRRRAGVGGPSSYPDAAETLRRRAGVGYEPAGPPEGGTGPQAEPHKDPACGCVGTPGARYAMFLGDEQSDAD